MIGNSNDKKNVISDSDKDDANDIILNDFPPKNTITHSIEINSSSISYLSNKSNDATLINNPSVDGTDTIIKWNTAVSEERGKMDNISNSKDENNTDKFHMDIGNSEISMKKLSIYSDCVSMNESEIEIKKKGLITETDGNNDNHIISDNSSINHRTEMQLTKYRNGTILCNKQNGTAREKSRLAQMNKNVTVPKPFVFYTSHRTSRQNKSNSSDSVSSETLDPLKSYCPSSIQRSVTEKEDKVSLREIKKIKTSSNIKNTTTIPVSFSGGLQPNLPSSKIRNPSLTRGANGASSSSPASKSASTGSLARKTKSAVDYVARKYSSLEPLPISSKNSHFSSSNIKLKVTEPKEFFFHTANVKSRRVLNMSTSHSSLNHTQPFSSGSSTSLSKSTDSDSVIRKASNLFSGKNTRYRQDLVISGKRQCSKSADHPNRSAITNKLGKIRPKLQCGLSLQISESENDSGSPSTLLNDWLPSDTKVFANMNFEDNREKSSVHQVKVKKSQPKGTVNNTQERIHLSEPVYVFKAQPIFRSAPFIPKRSTKPLTVSDESFVLHSEMRAMERKSHSERMQKEKSAAFTKKKSQSPDVQAAY